MLSAAPQEPSDGREGGLSFSAERRQRAELERLVAERTADRDRFWALSTDLMLTLAADRVAMAVNPAWTTMLGWMAGEVIGCNLLEFIHPDDVPSTDAAIGSLVQEATARRFEVRHRHKDGSYRWITWTAVSDGRRIDAVGRDFTAERAKTEAMKLVAARMRSVFETSYQYQGLMTPEGILLDANPTSLAGIAADLEDVVGKPFWETPWFTATPGMPELVAAGVPLVAAGKIVRQEVTVTLPGGRRIFDFSMRPVFDAAGAVIAIVPEAIDLTDHRAAEEQLRQAQKVEAVGQLTGGLAHDFNNLLTGISGSLELLEIRIAQGRVGELGRYIASAQAAAQRAAVLTHRLLAFARRQTLDPRPTDINRLVAGMEELIRRTVGPGIAVEVVGATPLWSTLLDQNQLESTLLNLCINARDAMPHGGGLTIETRNVEFDERGARERELNPGQYVSLSVRDTGVGMTRDVVARAFDPFFTTKPVGEGTGLGLSMVYGFARQSGGQAQISSEPGRGTVVELSLPRHAIEERVTERRTEAIQMPRAEQGQTVLVVDDESAVRMLLKDMLEDLGYAPIIAQDGAAGLTISQSACRIDLLITDLGLPGGMNGRQLADAARTVRPGLKVLFITGYGENVMAAAGALPPGMHRMSKPFAVEALARRIKDIIAGE